MMLRQGWAFATSPHGASQTIFRPGMSGVPDAARDGREIGRLARQPMVEIAISAERGREQAQDHGSVIQFSAHQR